MLKYFVPAIRLCSKITTATYGYPFLMLNSITDRLNEAISKTLLGLTDSPSFEKPSQMIQSPLLCLNDATIITLDGIIISSPETLSERTCVELDNNDDLLSSSIVYMAVPKSKVTRSKKRMKTTVQKRIPMKHHIVVDPRTGEVTLRHRLPFSWKDYLPPVGSSTTDSGSVQNKESRTE